MVGCAGSGPQVACVALLCRLDKALLWVEAVHSCSLGSRRHLCGKKKALHFLKGSPMPGPKVWSATASEGSEFRPNATLRLVPLHGVQPESRDAAWPLVSHSSRTPVMMPSSFSQTHGQQLCGQALTGPAKFTFMTNQLRPGCRDLQHRQVYCRPSLGTGVTLREE